MIWLDVIYRIFFESSFVVSDFDSGFVGSEVEFVLTELLKALHKSFLLKELTTYVSVSVYCMCLL